jgi:hypothetical protein
MDMPIRIEGERLVTTIYAIPMVPYQYILPNSCHPPCILTSLVFAQPSDLPTLLPKPRHQQGTLIILQHLQNCGYTSKKLLPLFNKGIDDAISYLSISP